MRHGVSPLLLCGIKCKARYLLFPFSLPPAGQGWSCQTAICPCFPSIRLGRLETASSPPLPLKNNSGFLQRSSSPSFLGLYCTLNLDTRWTFLHLRYLLYYVQCWLVCLPVLHPEEGSLCIYTCRLGGIYTVPAYTWLWLQSLMSSQDISLSCFK